MKRSLGQILYGYVFIFLAIRIGVDILADPIGYLLIAVGCLKLGENFKDGKTAASISFVLIPLSIPSVFIDMNLIDSGPWFYYSNALFAGEIILTFYLFRLLIKIAETISENDLAERTLRLFKIYIPANLLFLGLAAILTAFEFESLQVLSFVLLLIILVLNIAFILLLNAFRKIARDEKPPEMVIDEGSKGV